MSIAASQLKSPQAAPALQTIPVAPGRRPLMPARVLQWALYRDQDFVLQLIGERRLISFNIARAVSGKAQLVVWVPSILDYLAARPPTRATDETVIADILPGSQSTFPASYLCRLFTVSAEHIKNLLADGCLAIDKTRKLRPGPGMTRWFLRESLVNYLKKARYT
jgi:hypothetical protein